MRVESVPVDAAGTPSQPSLSALVWIFLRIACVSFGGFMTMISVTQNVLVERRKLLPDQDLLDAMALASMLPGPMAINVVAYVGYRLRGAAGALVCVCAALLPALCAMTAFSMLYFRWGHLALPGKLSLAVLPALAAVILASAWRMARSAVRGWREAGLTLAAAAALLLWPGLYCTLLVIAGAALAGWLCFGRHDGAVAAPGAGAATPRRRAVLPGWRAGLPLMAAMLALLLTPALLRMLLLDFGGISLVMFGGGYVVIPALQHMVADSYGWVTRREFADAIAMAQLTPGPVMISATFVGYKVAGVAGALAATAGMFAPSALLMTVCAHLFESVRESALLKAALHGVRAATTGMVAAAAITIGAGAAPVWSSALLFALAGVALLRFRIDAVWIVPAAGLLGLCLF